MASDHATDQATDELERNLAILARSLFQRGTVQGTLQLIVDLAVATVEGCDFAGVFLRIDGRVVTAAASDAVAVALDELQFATDEGPCLDAIREGGSRYAVDLDEDPRWLRFGPAAAEMGVRSAIAFRLSGHTVSALNLYARFPAAFGATDRAKGLIFATLAGLAVDAAGDRADDLQRVANLHEALLTREIIGQAQGILIERERITGEQAFDVLRRASQHLNIKIRDVARTLVETGQTPPTGPGKPPG